MPLDLSRNARRETLGRQYVEASLEVFAMPQVQDELGPQAVEITSALKTSYIAPYRGGMIRVPDDQADAHNLALHPLLRGERWHDRNEAEWLLPDDRAWIESNDPGAYEVMYAEAENDRLPRLWYRVPRPSNGWRTVGVVGPKHFSLSYLFDEQKRAVTSRSLIMVQGSSMPLPHEKMAVAAVIGHETDHANCAEQEMYGVTYDDCVGLRGTHDAHRAQLTRWENRAYRVTYGIARVAGADGPSVEDLAMQIDHTSPEHAAGQLRAMDRKYLPSSGRVSLEGMQFVAAGALALSHLFGDGSGHATPEEARAYMAAGLIKVYDKLVAGIK